MVYQHLFGPDFPDVRDLPPGRLLRLSELTPQNLPWLPVGPDGKSFSTSTWHRWAKNGPHGHKLKTIRAGGLKFTAEAWVLQFFESLSGDDSPTHARTPARRERAQAKAHRELDRAGI